MKRRVTVCCSAGPRVRAGNKPSIAINEVLQSQRRPLYYSLLLVESGYYRFLI